MKRYNDKRLYIVDLCANDGKGAVMKRSYDNPVAARIARGRRERDTGKTHHVCTGYELNQSVR